MTNEANKVLRPEQVTEIGAPLEDERLKQIEWQANLFEARDYPGTAKMLRELLAEIHRLRAGEDARLLGWLAKKEFDLRTHREKFEDGYTIWWQVVNRRTGESVSGHPLGSPDAALRAAIAAEGEWPMQRSELAEVQQENERLKREGGETRKWANLGGVPSGRTCAQGGHPIYGGGIRSEDGTDMCEVHFYQRTLSALQAELAAVTAHRDELLAKLNTPELHDFSAADPDQSGITEAEQNQ